MLWRSTVWLQPIVKLTASNQIRKRTCTLMWLVGHWGLVCKERREVLIYSTWVKSCVRTLLQEWYMEQTTWHWMITPKLKQLNTFITFSAFKKKLSLDLSKEIFVQSFEVSPVEYDLKWTMINVVSAWIIGKRSLVSAVYLSETAF